MIRRTYLDTAAVAVDLLDHPAIAAAWDMPSALQAFTVAGLAGHLARQVLNVPGVVTVPAPDARPITLLEHYTRSRWRGGGIDDETNVRIRHDGAREAAAGRTELVTRTAAALEQLRVTLPQVEPGTPVHLPWAGWSLSLDDFLVTRMLELTVHCDDLAVSVGVETPAPPAAAVDAVVTLLARLAVQRHGVTQVLRALSRAERAPATIAAI
ncbi:MAG TPA: maleylpyruvate isomerase N-terminal domain-containing protein [Euzebyales bacterium]|nr:maleylpyruvate isomerase N-terminal domain-containing protein [Euzebyales bacterium]